MQNNFNFYYYKYDPDGSIRESNLLYTPKSNQLHDKLCMHFCIDYDYRTNQSKEITNELLNYFYRQELDNLQNLQGSTYVPELFDYDNEERKIIIEWNRYTLSDMMFNNSNFSLSIKYQDNIIQIVEDLLRQGYWKMALYPHCFFIDKFDKIKTIDFYSAVSFDNRFIQRSFIDSIIGKQGSYRFDLATKNGIIDLKKFFLLNIKKHLPKYWPERLVNKLNEVVNDY